MQSDVLLLSVHDEILPEVPEENADAAVRATEEAIGQAFTAIFPVADTGNPADINTGKTWAEAKGKESGHRYQNTTGAAQKNAAAGIFLPNTACPQIIRRQNFSITSL